MVLPELGHHLQHLPLGVDAAQQAPTGVVLHRLPAPLGLGLVALPGGAASRSIEGHHDWSALAFASAMAAGFSWASNQDAGPPAAVICSWRPGVKP